MRALFQEYAPDLKDGTYIFVAKAAINEVSHHRFSQDFKKVIDRLKASEKR